MNDIQQVNLEQPDFHQEDERGEEEKTIEQREGERVAELVEKLYQELPARFCSHLVESSVVLILAGQKGTGEYHLALPEDKEKQREEFDALREWLERANGILEEEGHSEIKFTGSTESFDNAVYSIARGGEVLLGGIINFKALERLTKGTQIPNIPEYDSATGMEGVNLWRRETQEALKQARDRGELPNNLTDEALTDILHGVELGYPDRAILDFADWISQNEQDYSRIVDSEPLFVNTYSGPLPTFAYYPEHAQDPGIQENLCKTEETLQGFYESAWHKNLENDAAFLEARRSQENLHEGIYGEEREHPS